MLVIETDLIVSISNVQKIVFIEIWETTFVILSAMSKHAILILVTALSNVPKIVTGTESEMGHVKNNVSTKSAIETMEIAILLRVLRIVYLLRWAMNSAMRSAIIKIVCLISKTAIIMIVHLGKGVKYDTLLTEVAIESVILKNVNLTVLTVSICDVLRIVLRD